MGASRKNLQDGEKHSRVSVTAEELGYILVLVILILRTHVR